MIEVELTKSSYIKGVVMKHINLYNLEKNRQQKCNTPDPPRPNIFSLSEVYDIGRAIISEIEGKLSDKLININKEGK